MATDNGSWEVPEPCCNIWAAMHGHFHWMQIEGHDILCMPHLRQESGAENRWRINYCPFCGKPAPQYADINAVHLAV